MTEVYRINRGWRVLTIIVGLLLILVGIGVALEVGVLGSVSSTVKPGLRLAAALGAIGLAIGVAQEMGSIRAGEIRVSDVGLEAPGLAGRMRTVEWSRVAGITFQNRSGSLMVVRVEGESPIRVQLRQIARGDDLKRTAAEMWKREQARRG